MEAHNTDWSKETVELLKLYQQNSMFHPYTCGGAPDNTECERHPDNYQRILTEERRDPGTLIPTENGFVCPCGKYTQHWHH